MTGFALRAFLILIVLGASLQFSQAAPAYVEQIPGGKGSPITSGNGQGSVYIQQMPKDAKPIPVAKSPSRPRINYNAVSFIVQADVNRKSESTAPAIRNCATKTKKSLPSVESGASAVLADVSKRLMLPDVGPGLMNQQAK